MAPRNTVLGVGSARSLISVLVTFRKDDGCYEPARARNLISSRKFPIFAQPINVYGLRHSARTVRTINNRRANHLTQDNVIIQSNNLVRNIVGLSIAIDNSNTLDENVPTVRFRGPRRTTANTAIIYVRFGDRRTVTDHEAGLSLLINRSLRSLLRFRRVQHRTYEQYATPCPT